MDNNMKINYSHGVITPEEIIKFLSLTGQLQSVNHEIIKQKEVMKKAKELNLSVSTDELQEYADSFRVNHGLHSIEKTRDFLERGGLTEDDFEAYCEASLLTEKLMDHLAEQKKIEEYFVNNHSDFDLARIYFIVVKEKSLTDEILIQIQEEGKDFLAAAKQYSIDESTKFRGGYIGLITRNFLQPEVAAKVFNASPGDVLGPFEKEGLFELIMVEEVIKAELNSTVKERIKKLLFEEWLLPSTKEGSTVTL
jgi:parvulin-like peptidyl-prolyl isomerase